MGDLALRMVILGLVFTAVVVLAVLDIRGRIRLARKPLVYACIFSLPLVLPWAVGLILLLAAAAPLLLPFEEQRYLIIGFIGLIVTLLLLTALPVFILCRANLPKKPSADAPAEQQRQHVAHTVRDLTGYGTVISVINTVILATVLIAAAVAFFYAVMAIIGFVHESGGLLPAVFILLRELLMGLLVLVINIVLPFGGMIFMFIGVAITAIALGLLIAGAAIAWALLLVLQYVFCFNAVARYLRIAEPSRKWTLFVSQIVPIWNIITLRRIRREAVAALQDTPLPPASAPLPG